jgi:hypothetical protein
VDEKSPEDIPPKIVESTDADVSETLENFEEYIIEEINLEDEEYKRELHRLAVELPSESHDEGIHIII